MSLDIAQPLRIYAAVRRRQPQPDHQLEITVKAARDRRLSWTSVGLLVYLSTQKSPVVDYYGLPSFAHRGGITVEQLGAAVAELTECGYLVPYKDGRRVRLRGDGKQPRTYG